MVAEKLLMLLEVTIHHTIMVKGGHHEIGAKADGVPKRQEMVAYPT